MPVYVLYMTDGMKMFLSELEAWKWVERTISWTRLQAYGWEVVRVGM